MANPSKGMPVEAADCADSIVIGCNEEFRRTNGAAEGGGMRLSSGLFAEIEASGSPINHEIKQLCAKRAVSICEIEHDVHVVAARQGQKLRR